MSRDKQITHHDGLLRLTAAISYWNKKLPYAPPVRVTTCLFSMDTMNEFCFIIIILLNG